MCVEDGTHPLGDFVLIARLVGGRAQINVRPALADHLWSKDEQLYVGLPQLGDPQRPTEVGTDEVFSLDDEYDGRPARTPGIGL
jgi:hypothetical protein